MVVEAAATSFGYGRLCTTLKRRQHKVFHYKSFITICIKQVLYFGD